MKKHIIVFLLLVFSKINIFAQAPLPSDTIANFKGTVCAKSIPKKYDYKKYILPATLFTYGLLKPNIKGIKNFDESLKQNILNSNNRKKTKNDNYSQYSPIVAVYALNLSGYKGKNYYRDATLILATSQIISTIITHGVKKTAGRLRPDSSAFNSFSSGHTAESFANATFLYEEYKHKNIWIGIAGYAVAGATGYMRMYNNKHWFSDVVAGAGVGIASTKLAYWIYPKLSKKLFKNNSSNAMVIPSYGNGVFCMNFVGRF